MITVSEHARGDLVDRLGLPASKVRVTPEAADALMARPVTAADLPGPGRFDTNVVAEIFGTGTASDAIYVLVGVAALMNVPRLMEGMNMHVPGRPTRPHSA